MADTQSRAGKSYLTTDILAFVDRVHAAHDPALQRAFDAPVEHGMPAIQVSPSEGRLLEWLMALVSARNVVEVGTLAGYSAVRLGRALPPGGRLWTLESEVDHAKVARDNLAFAGLSPTVEVVEGPALQSLDRLSADGPFDAVFVDADKGNYPAYGAWAADNLRTGGLLVADNVFLFGRLMDDDPTAQAMRTFHEQAQRRFRTACVPTPDGLLLGIRN